MRPMRTGDGRDGTAPPAAGRALGRSRHRIGRFRRARSVRRRGSG